MKVLRIQTYNRFIIYEMKFRRRWWWSRIKYLTNCSSFLKTPFPHLHWKIFECETFDAPFHVQRCYSVCTKLLSKESPEIAHGSYVSEPVEIWRSEEHYILSIKGWEVPQPSFSLSITKLADSTAASLLAWIAVVRYLRKRLELFL